MSSTLDSVDVPWGKYTYALEGLATGCYLEGGASDLPGKRRLRFRIELPSRCFVMGVTLKLSNGASLHDITVARTLNNADYDVVYDGRNESDSTTGTNVQDGSVGVEEDDDVTDLTPDKAQSVENGDSCTSGQNGHDESTENRNMTLRDDGNSTAGELSSEKSSPPNCDGNSFLQKKKKQVEIRRAANSLRLTMTDIDDEDTLKDDKALSVSRTPSSVKRSRNRYNSSPEMRVLSVTVTGYTRGQTPPSKGLKLLLNMSSKLVVCGTLSDRAEIDGLLGLAFLGNRRYRQAAELLRRAAELSARVADEEVKSGFPPDIALGWAAQLYLLSAHAFFEHTPYCHDGISALLGVASISKRTKPDPASSLTMKATASPRDIRDWSMEFLDLRTELLSSIDPLLRMVVAFLGESESLAVRMASARMIEFIAEQLGCAISPYMSGILKQVLRSYHHCKPFGARDRPAANSFSYDSMEDCYERLIDICCKMLPITEHTVLHDLFDRTIVPIFQEAFKESEYLHTNLEEEEECNDLLCTAIAQTLRVSYLILRILEGDARIPASFVSRIVNILIAEDGIKRTPTLLRRTALHTWDAVCHSLTLGASGVNVKDFKEFLVVYKEYLGRLVKRSERPKFEYAESGESELETEVFKEETLAPSDDELLQRILAKRTTRALVVDRFTLGRLLRMMKTICIALEPCNEDDAMLTAAYIVFDLQGSLALTVADLLMSSLVDVSYHEACASGNGRAASNVLFANGSIHSYLKRTCEVLELLLECYWAAVCLLPSKMAAEAERTSPVQAVLAWCVHRMQHSSPPPGMLMLLVATVRGLNHERNISMRKLSTDKSSGQGDITFMQLYRSQLTWLSQTSSEHALDYADLLLGIVAGDLSARDVVRSVGALSDQSEQLDVRAEKSLNFFAETVAETSPVKPDVALKSLRELVDPSLGKQRILDGFPKPSSMPGKQALAFVRKVGLGMSSTPKNQMTKSFYLHVVLASCFDKFDSLGRLSKKRVGPSYMSERLDSFVEHAAILVRCLTAVAQTQQHREYMSSCIGDIFGSCLAMQDHVDGRVRLAGFEIFSAALDVLFLARGRSCSQPSTSISREGQPVVSRSFSTQQNGLPSLTSDIGQPQRTPTGMNTVVADLDQGSIEPDSAASNALTDPAVGSDSSGLHYLGNPIADGTKAVDPDTSRQQNNSTDEMKDIFADGGVCVFHVDAVPPSHLSYEDLAWQTLCMFMTSSLGVGKYVDFVVQRACLEYLKRCLVDSLSGRSSGASVLSFEHVEQIWDAVMRLVGSPWRTLNALSFWVSCAVLNVAFYSAISARGRQAKTRASQMDDFAVERLFPAIEKAVRSGTRETRQWGVRLLEVYLRAQEMNPSAGDVAPRPRPHLMHQISLLCHDWSQEVRDLASTLRDLDIDMSLGIKKSASVGAQSLSQASLAAMKRQLYSRDLNEGNDGLNASTKIELWFPALPKVKPVSDSTADLFVQTLEAFANAEVAGGEEVEDDEEEEQEAYEEEDDDFDDEQYDEDEEEEEIAVSAEEDSSEVFDHGATDIADDDPNSMVAAGTGDKIVSVSDENSEDNDEGKVESNGLRPPPIRMQDVNSQEDVSSLSPAKGPEGTRVVTSVTSLETKLCASPAADDVSASTIDKSRTANIEGDAIAEDIVGRESGLSHGNSENRKSIDLRSSSIAKVGNDDTSHEHLSVRERKAVFEDSGIGNLDGAAGRSGCYTRTPSSPASYSAAVSDLEEKMPGTRLRRKGSFSGPSRTASTSMISEEGEAPRLSRRRPTDQSGDGNSGLSSPSPRRQSTDAGYFAQPSSNGTNSLSRRRSALMPSANLTSSQIDDTAPFSPSSSEAKPQHRARDAVGGEFLGLLPKGGRIQRGVKLEDEEDAVTGTASSSSAGALDLNQVEQSEIAQRKPLEADIAAFANDSNEDTSNARGTPKSRNISSSGETVDESPGGRLKQRKLPRAAAFLKSDARLPRSNTGGSSPSSNSASSSRASSSSLGLSGSGLSGSRAKMLLTADDGRPLGSEPWENVAPDRSNRYGKRDFPLPLTDGEEHYSDSKQQNVSAAAQAGSRSGMGDTVGSASCPPHNDGSRRDNPATCKSSLDSCVDSTSLPAGDREDHASDHAQSAQSSRRSSRRILDSVRQFNSAKKDDSDSGK